MFFFAFNIFIAFVRVSARGAAFENSMWARARVFRLSCELFIFGQRRRGSICYALVCSFLDGGTAGGRAWVECDGVYMYVIFFDLHCHSRLP